MSENINIQEINAEAERLMAEAELRQYTEQADDKKDVVEKTEAEHTKNIVEDQNEERQFSPIELEQMEKGWDPNHPNGVSAEEFKRVGEIIEAKRKASKEAKSLAREVMELQKGMKQLIDHNKAVEKATYDRAMRELYERKLKLVEEGDVNGVMEVERQQASLTPPIEIETPKDHSQYTQEEINNNPSVIAFRDEFKDRLNGKDPADKAFQAFLQVRASEIQSSGKDIDIDEAINLLRDEIKAAFPHITENPNKDKPPLTLRSTVSPTKAAAKPSISKLSFEQRATLAQIQAVDPTYSTDEFIRQLELTGKLTHD